MVKIEPPRVRLLVSVRDAAEAEAALRGGADIIDVKEPARGALGMADAVVIAAVVAAVAERVPVSVAAGELLHPPAGFAVCGVSYVKVGLAGADGNPWREALNQRWTSLGAAGVAVAYADAARVAAPALEEVLRWSLTAPASGLLIDTAIKDGRGLLHWLDAQRLAPIITRAHAGGRFVALAGALTEEHVPLCVEVGCDVIAVRGAACGDGDRRASVDERRVRRLARLIAAPAAPAGRCAG